MYGCGMLSAGMWGDDLLFHDLMLLRQWETARAADVCRKRRCCMHDKDKDKDTNGLIRGTPKFTSRCDLMFLFEASTLKAQ